MLQALIRITSIFALGVHLGAHAQDYPSKPITMVVPFAAGGPTDVVARSLAQVMSKSLKQPVIIDNAVGAGGTIGTTKVAKAAPDGYTLLLMHIGFSTAPSLYRSLQYDAAKDFEPIGLVVDVPMTLVGKPTLAANDLPGLIAYIKANKDKVTYANAGLGSASHLCGLLFLSTIQADITTVPYKGTAPAMNDLLGGQVDFMCDQTTNTTGQIKAGKIKAYAVTSKVRVASLPNLPTAAEAGLPGFEVVVWHGLWAPHGTPKRIVDRLAAALQEALREPGFVTRMTELGANVAPPGRGRPDALRAHVKSEVDRWGPIIKKAGVYAD
ncbi:MAG: tripartite tricarboxylate transporter substrate binding protein BugD [Betaproteobacteria bacterium]